MMNAHPVLFPDRGGWRLELPSGSMAEVSSLAAAAEHLAAAPEMNGRVELAVPTRLALFEMLTLPAAEGEELAGMVELQMEKRLPYPLEETRHGFRIIGEAEEGESRVLTILAVAFQVERLESLCAPLMEAGCYPGRISLHALRVGEALGEGVAVAIWCEEDAFLFGVFEKGCPLLVEIFESSEQFCTEATRLLLAASVAGASSAPGVLWLDPSLREEGELLKPVLGVREIKTLPGRLGSRFPNLVPDQWRVARERLARRRKVLHGAKVAGVAVIGVAALAFGLLAWKRHQLRSMEGELERLRPGMESLLVTQARWNALAPAIDRERYTVELLHRVSELLPSEAVRITEFQHEPGGFRVRGEAPTPGEAVAYTEKLKEADFLQRYTLETPPPVLLEGGKASFVIQGK